ncbi:class I SAM-dependent DNA methyltransferase [Cellulosimicrobium protaetiae]|uniref:site-specific DNA-methyltransferase (adenine-specific) n=1 Tax=Cellulosimicrobium protaetiae TaxID=2587808 RepID=A0A6M5UAD1_9MICO|nr:class I SAM-dependent DNA methyltransferase [Cellulosimicrobium protaetiae]QJW35487.1 class I SAM-dependent DNA methyltransferase [Cellulosimicrobium protaetiae]
MAASDAIVVGEDWISEHYVGSDGKQSFRTRVLERRKAWDDAEKEGEQTTRARFVGARASLLSTLAGLGEEGGRFAVLPELYAELRRVLGYTSVALQSKQDGPVERVHATGLEAAAPLVIVEAVAVKDVEALLAKGDRDKPSPRDRTLLEPYAVDDTTQIHSVARLLSYLFVQDDAPEFALVLAGGWMLVAEKARWAEGRYLAVDLQLVAERADDKRGGETDTALTCVDAASLAPDPEGNLWWPGVLDESVKHTVGVSKDLREGVRLSIEIIANEVVRRRAAQGLDPLPQAEAQELAGQSLRFLYRILFLLFAEASPELGVLPVGDPTYEQGYSLDRLRELTLVNIADHRSQDGTHLYQSLGTLFRLVDAGHDGAGGAARDERVDGEVHRVDDGADGLTFQPLKADLFLPSKTAHIDAVGLGNAALQQVLRHLLLSKESKGKDRGFISYAELGINQLGAVYEGLMSYTGFFATEDLHEVAKDGNAEKGSWVVPVVRSQSIAPKDFVTAPDPVTGEQKPVVHEQGTFVFRLAGRERQQSASYYTPEVLTRFTVSQALVELIGPDEVKEGSVEWEGREVPRKMSAREILDLTVCEPALGSGAFAIEAVRQLAAAYLRRKQDETGERIDPDRYAAELQKVKAHIALHNVYGVDLNGTAVELAEISLWLDTMGEGLQAPWFGLHLKRGNSLIGARRAVYRRDQLAKRAWLTAVPTDVPLSPSDADRAAGRSSSLGDVGGRIHHFLLPAAGWGSAVEAKEAKELAPEALARLKAWRKTVLVTPSKKQADELVNLAHRVEALWDLAHPRLRIAEDQIRRSIDVWGADDLPVGGAVTRKQIEEALADAKGAYQRLRLVMDAWSALWFWPLTDGSTRVKSDDGSEESIEPPTLDEWIGGLRAVLGVHAESGASGRGRKWTGGDQTLASTADWDELNEAEEFELSFAGVASPERVLHEHPWLVVCQRVAAQQGFFHWELDFASVFATRGGFDLQVGNPPWVRPDFDEAAALGEYEVAFALEGKLATGRASDLRSATLELPAARDFYLDSLTATVATREAVSSPTDYPYLVGLRPDLYRCFMEQTWRHIATSGSIGLIHPETHFTDEKAGPLRAVTYRRLRRHWQFINELVLFEIHHLVSYGVHVYGTSRAPHFLQAASLYHPDTVERSFDHQGLGEEPGLKDPDGRWDVRPHAARVIAVDEAILRTWHATLEDADVPTSRSRVVYAVNKATASALDKISAAERIKSLDLTFSQGWNETTDFKRGLFEKSWDVADCWEDAIIQGPHLHVANPAYKTPNETMANNLDWSAVDLEALGARAIPATSYKPRGDRKTYDAAYTHWTRDVVVGPDSKPIDGSPAVDPKYVRHVETASRADGTAVRTETVSARAFYRIAWRTMAAPTGERTLIPALLPPGVTHVDGGFSAGLPAGSYRTLVDVAGFASSLVLDATTRVVPKKHIRAAQLERLPFVSSHFDREIRLRALRLNCVTGAYADLWAECYDTAFRDDSWTGLPERTGWVDLGDVGPEWTPETPLRRAEDRRQALLEIDALVALSLGLTADELCTIYRTQFPVLYGYDRNRDHYDDNGRLVPNTVLTTWRKKGGNDGRFSEDDLTAVHPGSGVAYTYDLPFQTLDREAHMRQAYAEFERRLAARAEPATPE